MTDQELAQWLYNNNGATDAQMRAMMDANGVTISQMANVTGGDFGQIASRYVAAGVANAPPPAPTGGLATIYQPPSVTPAPAPVQAPAPAPVAPSPAPAPATSNPYTISPTASLSEVAAIYDRFVKEYGGDTPHNQEVALQWLRSQGVPDNVISSAYTLYKGGNPAPAPTAAPTTPTTGGGMLTGSAQKPAIADQDIANWLYQNKGISDADIRKAMDQYGVSVEQMARVTGSPVSDVKRRYDLALMPQPAPKPVTASSGNGLAVSTQHPSSGMNTPQTQGDYMNQLNQYYGAYFGGAQPDQGLLNSWYNTSYVPPVTGYQKPATAASPEKTPQEVIGYDEGVVIYGNQRGGNSRSGI